jgi:hypothetical protein
VNREGRLRRELGTGHEHLAVDLGRLPVDQVKLIVTALRAARRAGREHDRAVRRQRRADAKRWYDEEQLADRNLRLLDATGKRAERSLDALEWLGQANSRTDELIALAVAGLRAQGVSWELIGEALGITRQAAWQRFGRQDAFTADRLAGGG